METIQLDNKTWIQGKAILLPTDKSRLSKYIPQNTLSFAEGVHFGIPDSMIPQHLYITDDSEIKEGDWCIMTNDYRDNYLVKLLSLKPAPGGNEIPVKLSINGNENTVLSSELKKIVATTNPELKLHDNSGKNHCFGTQLSGTCRHTLPQISEEFIKQWVNNPQEDVLIEVEGSQECNCYYSKFCKSTVLDNKTHCEDGGKIKYSIKTSPDNTVNLRFVEDDWESIRKQYKEWEGATNEEKVHYTTLLKFMRVQGFNPPKRKEK